MVDKTHTTDALMRATVDKTHKTDALIGYQGVTHFGTYLVGTGFTDGSTHPFGLEVYVKTLTNIGANSIDVTPTYVDQDGSPAETAIVSTSIPASTSINTYIKLALNTGDYAVRDITNITIVGGTAGDKFEIVSQAGGYYGKPLALKKATWDSFLPETLSGSNYPKPLLPMLAKLTPNFYPAPNPQMRPFIVFVKKIWDSFNPETLTGILHTGKIHALEKRPWAAFTGEPLTGSEFTGKRFPLQSSLFGNIVAGYLRLPSGTLITTGFRVILRNSSGFAVWGKCYSNGVYQVLLDIQRYDKTLLLVGSNAFEIYIQYGTVYIDGYVTQLGSRDLYFLPSQEAHVIGFKKKRLFA